MSVRCRTPRAAAALVAASVLLSSLAHAQFGGSGFGPSGGPGGFGGGLPGGGGTGRSGPAKPKKKSNEPETHAASGASDEVVSPGAEPTLPAEPLAIPKSVENRIGSDAALDDPEVGRGPETSRHFYGLYYAERSGDYHFHTLFPLWFERKQPSLEDPTKTDRASLYGGFFYDRRSATHSDDILFPLFWNLRSPTSRTTVVGPFVNRRAPGETDNWFAPLYFTGTRPHGGYTVIPPLLTSLHSDEKGGFNLIGPAFCTWTGGATCDTRTATNIDLGIAPFYFHGQTEESSYDLVPPLLHYHADDSKAESWIDVWGPVIRRHTEKRDALHILPLYYSLWGENERHTTLLPFFHYGHTPTSSLFINPLYYLSKDDTDGTTFITWGYAQHRGRTKLDMITPLYWHYQDPDVGLDEQLLFPFLYSKTSPRETNQAFFPFWGHFERYGMSETTFITPLFMHQKDLRGWSTNLLPIAFFGRDGTDTHTVIAPVFFDFASTSSRATIGFPIYWRFSDDESVAQVVANTYYHEKHVTHGLDWEFHFFPLFSYGETPSGSWWNVLYGLAGYTRRGENVQVRTLWIPINVHGSL